MSNKLYTEDQVRKGLWQTEHPFSDGKNVDEIINSLTPIELPTDEDILRESDEFELTSRVSLGMHISFELGAKWMRDKIQGGNK